MRIGHIAIDGRKFEFNRREVNELYKKNKAYTTIDNKKRMINILENLLNDDKDKNSVENFNNVNNHLEITSKEQNLNTYNKDLSNDFPTINVEEHIETLEDVRKAALSVPEPSLQDLRIAIEASNQLLQIKGNLNNPNEEKPKVELELLERLKNQIFVPNESIAIQNENNIEQVKFNKIFENAISKYKNQMMFAKNDFESEESKFSLIA